MKDASQFPITEFYGCQPGYPLNTNICPPGQGFHRGVDYGCPVGTPILVNGVTIGISGNTGSTTGPHLHIGRWLNGNSTDPGAGNGFKFNSAIVSEVGQDSTNGKFVRLQADGASWVYLHMSDNTKVKVGDKLEGGFMYPNKGDLINVHNETGWPGHELNDNDFAYWVDGTGNPNKTGNDRATALVKEVSNWSKSQSTNATVLKPGTLYKTP